MVFRQANGGSGNKLFAVGFGVVWIAGICSRDWSWMIIMAVSPEMRTSVCSGIIEIVFVFDVRNSFNTSSLLWILPGRMRTNRR